MFLFFVFTLKGNLDSIQNNHRALNKLLNYKLEIQIIQNAYKFTNLVYK